MKTVRFLTKTMMVVAIIFALTAPNVFGQDRSTVAKASTTAKASYSKAESGQTININQATLDQLVGLKGIGPVMAQRIVEFREKNGPFKKVEDLLSVKGIGEKKLEKMKSQVSL
jgi:comEA protein